MKHTTKFFYALAILALLLLPASPAFAIGPYDDGQVIFGGNYTLESGKTLNGDLVVFGGNVEIQEDALVKGSVVVFGGNVSMSGTMEGDLVIFGGAGSLGEKALVKGDLVTVGASVSRAEGSVVEGEITNEPAIEIPAPPVPEVPAVPEAPNVTNLPVTVDMFGPVASAFRTLTFAVIMGALAMLLALFLQPQMERVAETAFRQPLIAGGMGMLTLFSVFVAAIVLLITIIAPFLLAIALFAAWLFGLVAFGWEVGQRFTAAINQPWPPVLTAGFGTFLMVLVIGGFGMIPCLGGLIWLVVSLFVIGAVTLALVEARKNPSAMASPAAGPSEPLPPAL